MMHNKKVEIFIDTLPEFEPGWVWLVGAGPGDPGLLTLHSVNALCQADVIVYDALVDHSILSIADPHAEFHYAGKRGGKPSLKQQDISLKLVQLAKDGRRVCRLKGGDPFVFGRGAEEALTLVENSISFRVIPGISAGIGGLAYAGIPVTHRDTNHSVTFLTGHDAGGVVPDTIDWQGLARSSPVIVMYMAMKHAELIARKLMDAGRAADEPMAFVCHATTPTMTVHETTLGTVGNLSDLGFTPPAIIVIGEVVKLRVALDWFGSLHSHKLLKNSYSQVRA
ncbi:uroporphyrinogen-III C-methyltransferase [Candidatus Endowatersipora endosymbiont of Watersipora subatra]|uniref:uroporphyrinogen-III C-methyltransferase n=1 Tax=Candidatus Endowatersipora endosymbiont of Watersipora subatra TaxID=3077946 RepID=UPI00312C74CE